MEFRVLGSLEVVRDARPVPVGGPQRGLLLAALLSEANRPVVDEKLLRAMHGDGGWDEDRRPQVVHGLRVQIGQLRAVLGQQNGQLTEPLGRVGDAYVLKVGPDELDEFAFLGWLERARRHRDAGDPKGAAERADRALALWRGDPLANLVSRPIIDTYARRLRDLRLEAERERSAAYLAAGRHTELVGIVRRLAAEHPADERFREDLALALYRDGRPADAAEQCRHGLSHLQRAGLHSRDLARLQERILRNDPTLRWTDPGPSWEQPELRAPPPAQLPPDTGAFVGRDDEVRRLLAGFQPDSHGLPRVGVAAIAGKAGVGKTALAVHVAYRLRGAFPDGALYVNLQTTPETPTEPRRVLVSLLLDLGIQRQRIPEDLGGRAALFRSALDGRRMVMVLDNAVNEEQIRPLLPGGRSIAVLVTSRRALAGLDVDHTVLDVLDSSDAVELLARVAGPGRIAAEADHAQAIVDLCGQLPLAVRIAGARLAQWPDASLAWLHDQLLVARLNVLRAGDLEVRASFDLSYRALPPVARRAFRLLSVPETEKVSLAAAAALLDVDVQVAADVVDGLAEVQLVERKAGGGSAYYQFHDLLRLFARERLTQEDDPAQARDALSRVLETSLAYAETAAPVLFGGNHPVVPRGGTPPRIPIDADTITAAVADPARWFDRERADLVALVEHAGEAGLDELTWLLSAALIDFFDVGAHWTDWQRTHEAALAAAERRQDRLAAANTRRNLGRLLRLRGDRPAARRMLEASLASFLAEGWRLGEAAVRRNLAELDKDEERWAAATRHLARTLELYRELNEDFGSGRALMTLGEVFLAEGRLAEAITQQERAIHYFTGIGNGLSAAMGRRLLGAAYLEAGSLPAAIRELAAAEHFFHKGGHHPRRAESLLLLGDAYAQEARDDDALRCYDTCLSIFEDRHDELNRGRALAHRGRLHHWRADDLPARSSWTQALAAYGGRGGAEEEAVRGWLDGAPPGPRTSPRRERVLHRFPHAEFIGNVAVTQLLVRIMNTWTELLDDEFRPAFLAALRTALTRGALVQILLLRPDSPAARDRTRELRRSTNIGDLARANLHHLRTFVADLPPAERDRVEVRLYSAGTFVAYHRLDSRALTAVLHFGGSSSGSTQYEVPIDSNLAQVVEERFAELWATGTQPW